MLKHGLLTTLLATLFSMTPAMADHHETGHEGAKHPAHEMGEAALSDSDKTEQLSEEYRENLEAAKESENPPHPAHKMGAENTHKGQKHPAHEMGEAAKSANEQSETLSEDYKENLEKVKDGANAPHPAHEMGEGTVTQ
jgi:hypothetical protein